MRRYEQIYILRPTLSEDEITTVIENTNQLILDDNGAIIYLNKWGMKKMAYPIKKEAQGYYVLCDFAATPDIVSEIERKFRIDDSVLKYLTVKISDAITDEEIETARNEAEANAIVPDSEEAAEEVPEKTETAEKKEKPAEVTEEVVEETVKEAVEETVEEAVEETVEEQEETVEENTTGTAQ